MKIFRKRQEEKQEEKQEEATPTTPSFKQTSLKLVMIYGTGYIEMTIDGLFDVESVLQNFDAVRPVRIVNDGKTTWINPAHVAYAVTPADAVPTSDHYLKHCDRT